jgi:hypothetical protein
MSNWIIYGLALSQIVILYGLFPAVFLRLMPGLYFLKNPEWIAQNPDFKLRSEMPALAAMLFYVVGLAWLVLLLYFKPSVATDGFQLGLAPACVWLVMLGACLVIDYFRVERHIPLPEQALATPGPRALRHYLNPYWVWLCFGLYAASILANALMYYQHHILPVVFERRMTGTAITLGIFTLALLYGLYRKPKPQDDIWGSSSRKLEVMFYLAVLYAGLLPVWARVIQDAFLYRDFDNAVFVGTVNVLIQVLVMVLLFKVQKHSLTGPKGPAAPAVSAPRGEHTL